ncbi:MAG: diguanylate cyclase [Bryobacter sp.]|jgi:diguanylate cyclase (GGDEF)-like protein|nr:diguanylate cyclase [Bryobacter sp.]
MRVLIADDSIVSRHLLEATLRRWGYEVIAACDGREAWDVLQSDDAPPLAILDWVMPGMSGLDVCREVRRQNRYTYILLLTSKNNKEDLVEGMDAGADDYITKPFEQAELKVRLRAGTRIVELQQELRRQATRDPLTGVYNRSKAFEILSRELARTAREKSPLGIVLVDLDNFKRINDTHGHLAGDEALREAAARLGGAIRPYDALARYGGEEFLVIFPGCSEPELKVQAERLRVAVSAAPVRISSDKEPEMLIPLTASFGLTTASLDTAESAQELIRIADEALYEAKRRGRNCVVFQERHPKGDLGTLAHALHEPVGS